MVESNFRYKGPNPQSKETGIVSLADIVESATRSMGRVSCEEMQKKVDELLKQRVVDKPPDKRILPAVFQSNPLALCKCFLEIFFHIHHNRIAYPSPAHSPEAKIEKNAEASEQENSGKQEGKAQDGKSSPGIMELPDDASGGKNAGKPEEENPEGEEKDETAS